MKIGRIISFYILRAVVPYIIFSWLLLSVVLFVQNAGRYSDIFFGSYVPSGLIWQLTAALLPNVIAFTCPMAVLAGVVIGLSRMQGDRELGAIRAAGIGNFRITLPVVLLGLVLSAFAFFINISGVPAAASIVRSVAIRAAIAKLESPIEPGVFNTEIAGYTVYVKGGDIASGSWENIFIHTEDRETGDVRLITSSRGRIDSSDERSELVLSDSVSTTFSSVPGREKFVSESIGEIRLSVKTRRGDLVERLSRVEIAPEELGILELAHFAAGKEGKERVRAEILLQRRVLLSVTPIIFSLLGSALVLRFNRGGRGFGVFLALVSLIAFYLLAFLGEQLARTGRVTVLESGLLPVVASVAAILWFNFANRLGFSRSIGEHILAVFPRSGPGPIKGQKGNILMDVTTGLRDFDLLIDLLKYYALALTFVGTVFMIFTAFETWRFAGEVQGGVAMLFSYLAFLVPFVYLQLSPSAAMIAVLATYIIKSRQNEVVTWIAAGQSVYRLMFPAFLLMLFLGIVNWRIDERIAVTTNQIQEELRNRLRGQARPVSVDTKYWIADRNRIISFAFATSASDNGIATLSACAEQCPVREVTVFQSDDSGLRLQTLFRVSSAVWNKTGLALEGPGTRYDLESTGIRTTALLPGSVIEVGNPLVEVRKKPAQLSTGDLRQQIERTESESERRGFAVSLERKYANIFLPFVISLFTAPFALSLSRKGKVVMVGYAVGLWLVFLGVSSAFEQLGLAGSLPPLLAVWGPIAVFTLLGLYLLTKVRT